MQERVLPNVFGLASRCAAAYRQVSAPDDRDVTRGDVQSIWRITVRIFAMMRTSVASSSCSLKITGS